MADTGGDDSFEVAYSVVNLVGDILGCAGSLFTMIIIQRMNARSKSRTGHLTLLWYIAVIQFFCDASVYFANVEVNSYMKIIAYAIIIPGNTAAIILSNWMVFAAWYIVTYKKAFNVIAREKLILATAIIPSLVILILYIVGVTISDPDLIEVDIVYTFNNLRIACVAFNAICIVIIAYNITNFTSTKRTLTKQTITDVAIRTLAMRMMFYPLAQILSHSGYAWYEYQFGTYRTVDDHMPDEKMVCLMYIAVFSSTAPVAYLIILCCMQPKAYMHFKAICCCLVYEKLEKEYLENLDAKQRFNSAEDTGSLYSSHQSIDMLFEDHTSSDGQATETRQDEEGIIQEQNSLHSRPIHSIHRNTMQGGIRPSSSRRHSERLTEEIIRMTNHSLEDKLSIEDWNVVLRVSMQQEDNDLCDLLEEIDQYGDEISWDSSKDAQSSDTASIGKALELRASTYGTTTKEKEASISNSMETTVNILHKPSHPAI